LKGIDLMSPQTFQYPPPDQNYGQMPPSPAMPHPDAIAYFARVAEGKKNIASGVMLLIGGAVLFTLGTNHSPRALGIGFGMVVGGLIRLGVGLYRCRRP
jgi:hypothetical protein